MPTKLQGLVTLLSGASRGIGRRLAHRLAEKGVALAISSRQPQPLENLAAELRAMYQINVTTLAGDLADPHFADMLIGHTIAHFGRLDVLINNAGLTLSKPLQETSIAESDTLFAVNCRAPFLLCRQATVHLRRSPSATVINIASVMGHKGYRNQGAYAASKHALMGLSKVLAQELQADLVF